LKKNLSVDLQYETHFNFIIYLSINFILTSFCFLTNTTGEQGCLNFILLIYEIKNRVYYDHDGRITFFLVFTDSPCIAIFTCLSLAFLRYYYFVMSSGTIIEIYLKSCFLFLESIINITSSFLFIAISELDYLCWVSCTGKPDVFLCLCVRQTVMSCVVEVLEVDVDVGPL
jgi:hypothetical protein